MRGEALPAGAGAGLQRGRGLVRSLQPSGVLTRLRDNGRLCDNQLGRPSRGDSDYNLMFVLRLVFLHSYIVAASEPGPAPAW